MVAKFGRALSAFFAMKYFAFLGLPVLVLHNREELDTYDEERLSQKYNKLLKNANFEHLHMDFWIKRIQAGQALAKSTGRCLNML